MSIPLFTFPRRILQQSKYKFINTFIAVRQHCSHCEHQRQWTSQPRIKDTPAGNALLSAAILFSGATPGKL